ncbi:MAG: hypothetical protein SGI77_08785 [Pirellulaceae bacterium]|nr:hypothetical protein [Pirellulaceae bacterium]
MPSRFISDETLLGYILDALDEPEHKEVSAALLKDRFLRIRLTTLQSMAGPLAPDNELIEPPGAMVSRVMSQVDDERDFIETSSVGGEHSPNCPDKLCLTASGASGGTRSSFRSVWLDTGISMLAATIGVCLAAPAILQTRETARSSQCSSGLMALGQQIHDFAFQNRQACVPEISTDGPLAFAGAYAIHLNDTGHLEDTRVLWCPSERNNRFSMAGMGKLQLPSASKLKKLTEARLRFWQHVSGGSYAYNLGVVVNNQHRMPTIESSSNIAILADAPVQLEGSKMKLTAHRGFASNVLYQDGRIQLLRFDKIYDGYDHPYLNRKGLVQAGLDRDDSALGPSYLRPLDPACAVPINFLD